MSQSMRTDVIKFDVDEKIPFFDFDELSPLQGDLKDLDRENFGKLKNSILTRGFFVPLFLWKDPKGGMKLLDGHQRMRVLGSLREDGFVIDKVPGVMINAANEKEAKEKILLITSAYGRIAPQGLYEFLVNNEIDPNLLNTDIKLPDLKSDLFLDAFFKDGMPIMDMGNESDLKTITLNLTQEKHQAAMAAIKSLQGRYGTRNQTATILEALKREMEKT